MIGSLVSELVQEIECAMPSFWGEVYDGKMHQLVSVAGRQRSGQGGGQPEPTKRPYGQVDVQD